MPSFNPLSLISLLPAALALAGSASAGPIAPSDPTRQYYVRTFAVENNRFDNLYLYGINIDAGIKSALLSSSRSSAVKGYMEDGRQWFAYGTQFPYGLNMNDFTKEAGKLISSPERGFAVLGTCRAESIDLLTLLLSYRASDRLSHLQ